MPLKTVAPGLFRRHDDEAAFERLYERNVEGVYRYALGMLGDSADAEDVTQTTFLNAYRAFKGGTRPEKPHSWLIAIAHNVCRQRFRHAQRRPREVAFDEGIGEVETVEPSAPSAEDLRRALSELPQNQRAALVMRELEGCSYAEIAGVLGISVSALETLLFRARRSLREQLEERLTCHDAVLAIDRQLDGRLSLAERRALRAHLRACPECNSLAQSQRAQRRALKALVLVPLPLTIAHWAAPSGASAATGASGLAVAGTGSGAGAGAGAGASSAMLGGVAAKVAALAIAGVVVGGTYEGVRHIAREGEANAAAAVAANRASAESKLDGRTNRAKGAARAAAHTRKKSAGHQAAGRSSARSNGIVSSGGHQQPAGHTVDATAPSQETRSSEPPVSSAAGSSPTAAETGVSSTSSGSGPSSGPSSKAATGSKVAPASQAVTHSQAAAHSQAAQHSNAAAHSQAAGHSQATPHSQSGSQGSANGGTTTPPIESPGNSGTAPGHSNDPPGNSGSPPGQTNPPGNAGGNSGSAPGQTNPPGNSGSPPGQTNPPGNSGDSKGKGH